MGDVEDTVQITCRPRGPLGLSATSRTAKRELQIILASTFPVVAPVMMSTSIFFHHRQTVR
jgi:hypothetical protein